MAKFGQENRQTGALVRREHDVETWQTLAKSAPPENFDGTVEEWAKFCNRKVVIAEQDVATLKEKLESKGVM